MFGIYLIHDHILVGQTIYSDVFHCFEYTYSMLLPLYVLMICSVIMITCIILDWCRGFIFTLISNKRNGNQYHLSEKIDAYLEKHLRFAYELSPIE